MLFSNFSLLLTTVSDFYFMTEPAFFLRPGVKCQRSSVHSFVLSVLEQLQLQEHSLHTHNQLPGCFLSLYKSEALQRLTPESISPRPVPRTGVALYVPYQPVPLFRTEPVWGLPGQQCWVIPGKQYWHPAILTGDILLPCTGLSGQLRPAWQWLPESRCKPCLTHVAGPGQLWRPTLQLRQPPLQQHDQQQTGRQHEQNVFEGFYIGQPQRQCPGVPLLLLCVVLSDSPWCAIIHPALWSCHPFGIYPCCGCVRIDKVSIDVRINKVSMMCSCRAEIFWSC